jgi:hypothetical protein
MPNPSSSSRGGPFQQQQQQGEDPPDATTMAILSAGSWETLYDLFYSSSSGGAAAPTHQHCYGYLIALSELLPELDQPPPTAVAAAGVGVGGSSGGGSNDGGNSGGSSADLDSGWEALRAAGKVVSWNQLTALRVSSIWRLLGSRFWRRSNNSSGGTQCQVSAPSVLEQGCCIIV